MRNGWTGAIVGIWGFVFLLSSCSGIDHGLGSRVERAVRSHYEYWAVENGALCTTPRIGAITHVEEIARAQDRLELKLRYDIVGGIGAGDPGEGPQCKGFNDRRFVLTRTADEWTVTYMSGWQYKEGDLDLGNVNLRVRKPPVLGGVIYKP